MQQQHYPHIERPGFGLDVWQWRTVGAFRAHLAGYRYRSTALWASGCLLHHTVKPLAADWRGPLSMQALADYYAGLGWTFGPHLFVCSGAPDPSHDGIWQLTPLSVAGIHGNAANSWAWGVEMVGNYDAAPPPADVSALACGAMAALLDWAGLRPSAETIRPHKTYNPNKTCPGLRTDMRAMVRATVALSQGGR